MLEWLQEWYKTQCNGDWEHDHVIKIETLDNPGWYVEIDFNNTNCEIKDSKWNLYELNDNNWIGYKIENNVYSASGDFLKLTLILKIFNFLMLKNNNNTIDNFINQELNQDKIR